MLAGWIVYWLAGSYQLDRIAVSLDHWIAGYHWIWIVSAGLAKLDRLDWLDWTIMAGLGHIVFARMGRMGWMGSWWDWGGTDGC